MAIVSDHALLRYLERAHGIPVEEIRASLAASAAIAVAHDAPAVVLGKVKLIVVDGRVVTVMKSSWKVRVRRGQRPPAGERRS